VGCSRVKRLFIVECLFVMRKIKRREEDEEIEIHEVTLAQGAGEAANRESP
jgi:hypothetical protein